MAARTFLTRCAHAFGRGEQTMQHLRALGLPPERFSRAADMAFLLEEHDALSCLSTEYAQQLIGQVRALKVSSCFIVGICPSSLLYKELGQQYVTMLADLIVDRLRAADAILLYPNATRADRRDKLFNNDLPVIDRILAALPPDCDRTLVFSVDRDVFAVDIKRLIALCDMVVVSRFHAMVAALAAGVPPLVLGWSHKYTEVMNDFELAEGAFNFDIADKFDLPAEVDNMRGRLEVIRARISGNLDRVRALSTRQIEHVVASFD
jgi:colanic acid/amylovoran biosynthesis protein